MQVLANPKLYAMLLVISVVQSPMTYDLVDSLVGQATGMKLITGSDGRPGKARSRVGKCWDVPFSVVAATLSAASAPASWCIGSMLFKAGRVNEANER